MKTLRKYGNRIEAEFDHARLESSGITSFVFGLGVVMEGGMEGVRLQVPDEDYDAALAVLNETVSLDDPPAE